MNNEFNDLKQIAQNRLDTDPVFRDQILHQSFQQPTFIKILLREMKDEALSVRLKALGRLRKAIEQIGFKPEIADAFRDALQSSAEEERLQAVRGIGQMGVEGAKRPGMGEALLQTTYDKSEEVARGAVAALFPLALRPDVRRRLKAMLASEYSALVRSEVESVLGETATWWERVQKIMSRTPQTLQNAVNTKWSFEARPQVGLGFEGKLKFAQNEQSVPLPLITLDDVTAKITQIGTQEREITFSTWNEALFNEVALVYFEDAGLKAIAGAALPKPEANATSGFFVYVLLWEQAGEGFGKIAMDSRWGNPRHIAILPPDEVEPEMLANLRYSQEWQKQKQPKVHEEWEQWFARIPRAIHPDTTEEA